MDLLQTRQLVVPLLLCFALLGCSPSKTAEETPKAKESGTDTTSTSKTEVAETDVGAAPSGVLANDVAEVDSAAVGADATVIASPFGATALREVVLTWEAPDATRLTNAHPLVANDAIGQLTTAQLPLFTAPPVQLHAQAASGRFVSVAIAEAKVDAEALGISDDVTEIGLLVAELPEHELIGIPLMGVEWMGGTSTDCAYAHKLLSAEPPADHPELLVVTVKTIGRCEMKTSWSEVMEEYYESCMGELTETLERDPSEEEVERCALEEGGGADDEFDPSWDRDDPDDTWLTRVYVFDADKKDVVVHAEIAAQSSSHSASNRFEVRGDTALILDDSGATVDSWPLGDAAGQKPLSLALYAQEPEWTPTIGTAKVEVADAHDLPNLLDGMSDELCQLEQGCFVRPVTERGESMLKEVVIVSGSSPRVLLRAGRRVFAFPLPKLDMRGKSGVYKCSGHTRIQTTAVPAFPEHVGITVVLEQNCRPDWAIETMCRDKLRDNGMPSPDAETLAACQTEREAEYAVLTVEAAWRYDALVDVDTGALRAQVDTAFTKGPAETLSKRHMGALRLDWQADGIALADESGGLLVSRSYADLDLNMEMPERITGRLMPVSSEHVLMVLPQE